ncbi:MAG: hypothetical protein JSU73_08570 [candidate division WOR-3 bacterium]|nr:MAG: hypothetical protein JSU73_08570 [candidate division WOR-3 bacterium]
MENPGFTIDNVNTTRPYFEAIHSLFKQTAARIGWMRSLPPGQRLAGDRIALEFLIRDEEQADKVRQMIRSDLAAKLDRLSPSASGLEDLFRLLTDSCRHPSNLYTEVHWFPVHPDTNGR